MLVPFTGLVTTVPLLLFAYAARRVRLAMLGWPQYWVPTINLVLGVAVYDESMPASRIAGFALVWIALALITDRRLPRISRTSAGPRHPSRPSPSPSRADP